MSMQTLNIRDNKELIIKVMNHWLKEHPAYEHDFTVVDIQQVGNSLGLVYKNETNLNKDLRSSLIDQMCKALGLSLESPLQL